MKAKIKKIKFPIFSDYLVHVELISDLGKALAKYDETREVSGIEGSGAMTIHVKDECRSFIFIKQRCSLNIVAHESWHAVRRMMIHMGVELDSETVAYHLGYLVEEIFNFSR